MTVGITGGIGTGKSTVTKIFETLGVPVYDADSATKNLMANNATLINSITQHFGEETYINNTLNRKFLASIVFNEEKKLTLLNSIVHPYSLADFNEWSLRQKAAYVVKETALLFETEAFHYIDFSIGVTAPNALRIHRVMKRDNCTRTEVMARMEKQIPDDIKMKLCNKVIVNDEQQLIIPQVVHLHQYLLNL
jgi:dephospho-CoA kinase